MFDTMLSRDIQQTLEHFRRTMDQALSEFFAPSGLRGSTTDGTEWTFTPTVLMQTTTRPSTVTEPSS